MHADVEKPEVETPGLWSRVGTAPVMARPHRHDDVELNVVRSGTLRYLFGGEDLTVSAGELALFWGGTPHQLVRPGTDDDGDALWLHVPLTTVLSWSLPAEHVATLLQPYPVVLRPETLGYDAAAALARWHDDLSEPDPGPALLEIEGLVRRLLRAAPRRAVGGASRDHLDAVVQMTRLIADRFREPITAADVAAASHLHPTYAMTLFRRVVGCTIGAYLTRCRVAEAQRLLVTTRLATTEVGTRAGFGSQSQFYDHFTRTCGRSPGRYRVGLGATASA